jgi:predicted nucleic acid-binding protein
VSAALKDKDPEENSIFLACTVAGQADYFITGDRNFTEASKLVTTTILYVSQFKRLVCDAIP